MTDFGLHRQGDRYVYGTNVIALLDDVGSRVVVEEVAVSGNSATKSINSGRFYKFIGTLASISLTLVESPDTEGLSIFAGKFNTGSGGCVLTVKKDNNSIISSGVHLSGNATYEFYIVDDSLSLCIVGGDSAGNTEGINVINLSVNEGTFQQAYSKATESPTIRFQWLLSDVDNAGRSFSKMIWHIGNGVFVDASGATVSQ